MIMRYILFSITIVFITLNGFAQSSDTLKLFSEFIEVSTGYKQLPLYLSLECRRTSNIPFSEEDSSVIQSDFYMQARGAYIHFGEMEQVVTDSMVLIILNQEKQMVLSETGVSVVAQLQATTGMKLPDTSLRNMADRYIISKIKSTYKEAIIRMENKIPLYATTIPTEAIELVYDTKEKVPIKITTTKRSFFPRAYIDDNKSMGLKIVTIDEKGEFVVKEDVVVYNYKKIEHDENMKLPVLLSDRIIKDAEMNFVPVKAFESYTLIKN